MQDSMPVNHIQLPQLTNIRYHLQTRACEQVTSNLVAVHPARKVLFLTKPVRMTPMAMAHMSLVQLAGRTSE